MFYEIFRFEIRRAFHRPAIYLYWFLMFLFAFLFMNAAGGAFKGFRVGVAGENVFINSPGVIDILFGTYSYLGIFVVAAICSNIVFKDFSHNTLELMFSTPLRKTNYIFGRFSAAFILSTFVFTGVAAGLLVGTYMPYINQALFGPNELVTYAKPYFTRVLPNLFVVCSLFFSLSLLLRNVVVNWISIIVLYAMYAIAMSLFRDLDNQTLASLLDPFGIAASLKVTASSSANDMNEKGAALVNVFLYNRIIWVAFGALVIILAHARFRFAYNLRQIKFFGKKNEKVLSEDDTTQQHAKPQPECLQTSQPFGEWWFLTRFETRKLFTNVYFLLISLLTVIFLFLASKGVGKTYDTTTYPVTYQVLGILGGSIKLFLFIVVMIFSGEMIWRDREANIFEISQTYPTRRWSALLSKFSALSFGIVFLLSVLIVCGVISQAAAGYFNFELPLYLKWVFGISFIDYLLLIVLAFAVHILVNNKYFGYVTLVLYWIIDNYFAYKLFKHHLLVYSGAPSVAYSDMDGFGFEVLPYWIFKLYWVLIAVVLMILSNQLLVTQTEDNWQRRLQLFTERFRRSAVKPVLVLGVLIVGYGAYIFYQTNIENDFSTAYQNEKNRVDYELQYKKFAGMQQPKITDVNIEVELYPNYGNLLANGTYRLENKSGNPVDTLWINTNEHLKEINLDRNAELVLNDEKQNLRFYALKEPLKPGEKMKLDFVFEGINDGFSHGGANNFCRKNGTFLYNSYFPSFGYSSGNEIKSKRTRRKHDLPELKIVRDIDDPVGIANNFITDDADFINFEATVSTSADQTALTPGKLVRKWSENNRNYFQYKSEKPMLNYYAILSGEYEVRSEKWVSDDSLKSEVEINIFYHKSHTYNLDNMLNGVKISLSNYSKMYTPYQYGQLNVVEFPRYSSYAQSFPNLIPFSEGIGFISDLRKLDDETLDFEKQPIDYPFFVTTHEMAHQWWAHQVVAANVEGAQMLMESITQYSALQCMKDTYGPDKMKKFFRSEMNRYILSRKNESIAERPLATVSTHQSSTYYNKGALVMNSLSSYLGEERFLSVVREFIGKYAFKGAPYPTTADFISKLKAATPDSLQYFVEDQLEKITFYDLKTDSATYQRNKDFTYTVTLNLDVRKTYAAGNGEETETSCDDYIEIGVYNSKDKVLYKEKVKLKSGENMLELQLKRKPSYLIVDPDYLLMFKSFERNKVNIEKKQ